MKHWYEGYSHIDILSLYTPMSAVKTKDKISLHGWLAFPRWYESGKIPRRHYSCDRV